MYGALILRRVHRNSQNRESINQSFHYKSAQTPEKSGTEGLQPRIEEEQANAETFVIRKFKQYFCVLYTAERFCYKTITWDDLSPAVTVDDLAWQLRKLLLSSLDGLADRMQDLYEQSPLTVRL